jgi:glucokinase
MTTHIIVSGIPASGKSRMGRAIADALALEFLDKDDFLEELFNTRGIGDARWRNELSRAADNMLRDRALNSAGAVITSWWRHPRSQVDSGTPIDWLGSLSNISLEIHCVCDPAIAAERFLRRARHEGHLDRFKNRDELLMNFKQQFALGPLSVATVVEVNTNHAVEVSTLISRIQTLTSAVSELS